MLINQLFDSYKLKEMNYEFKGTNGNWFHMGNSHSIFHPNKIGEIIAMTFPISKFTEFGSPIENKEQEYNALLISKAPEMFEMLKSVLQLQQEKYGNGSGLHLAMIGKAKEIEQLLKDATTI